MLCTNAISGRYTHEDTVLHLEDLIILREIHEGWSPLLIPALCLLVCIYIIAFYLDKTISDKYAIGFVKVVKLLGYSNFLAWFSVVR